MKYKGNNARPWRQAQEAVVLSSRSTPMSQLTNASSYDVVSFVWARNGNPIPQPCAAQDTFQHSPVWKPVRLIIELARPIAQDIAEEPERWDGMA